MTEWPWPSVWFDKAGNPLNVMEYARLHEDPDYYLIGRTDVDQAQVSTVWIGINMNYSNDGPPIIFETMIFGGPLADYTWRYVTEDDARAGHAHAVALAEAARQGYVVEEVETVDETEAWEWSGDAARWSAKGDK